MKDTKPNTATDAMDRVDLCDAEALAHDAHLILTRWSRRDDLFTLESLSGRVVATVRAEEIGGCVFLAGLMVNKDGALRSLPIIEEWPNATSRRAAMQAGIVRLLCALGYRTWRDRLAGSIDNELIQ